MNRPDEQAVKIIFDSLGFHFNWFNREINLGDIGYFENGFFRRAHPLNNFGITPIPGGRNAPYNFNDCVMKDTSVVVKINGEITSLNTPASAGGKISVEIAFASKNGLVFQSNDYASRQLDNIGTVEDTILDWVRHKDVRWNMDYVIVDSIMECEDFFLATSRESHSTPIKLDAGAHIQIGQAIRHSDAGLNLCVTENKSEAVVCTPSGKGRRQPFFTLLRVKKTFWGKVKTQPTIREKEQVPGLDLSYFEFESVKPYAP